MLSSVASEAPTRWSFLIRWISLRISMVPLEILVGICSAWKKDVFSGPRPVFWAGIMTSSGASAPARAGALTLFSMIFSRTSPRSSLVKTKPTLPLMWGRSFSRAGLLSRCPRMALRIMVFLPMRRTAWLRSETRIVCICLEPTLSTPTMKHLGYSSSSCTSRRK
uniref:Putative 60s acidic ribosomal protein p0 n=1 Tax=Ixodes ricinus TaxID=34613 RepID=A0A6B0UZ41_IXORI